MPRPRRQHRRGPERVRAWRSKGCGMSDRSKECEAVRVRRQVSLRACVVSRQQCKTVCMFVVHTRGSEDRIWTSGGQGRIGVDRAAVLTFRAMSGHAKRGCHRCHKQTGDRRAKLRCIGSNPTGTRQTQTRKWS
eukprot:1312711-Rhodomonas_salina.1